MIGVADNLQALTTKEPPNDIVYTYTLITCWLRNLDVIQQRNKPKEPPPEKAPFFLPTLPGVEHRFAITQKEEPQAQTKKTSKRLEPGAAHMESKFYRKLISEDPEGNYEDFFVYLKTLTPAGLDLELRSLGSSLEGLRTLINALCQRLRSHRDFEAVQAVIGAVLRLHGEVFVANPELCDVLESLKEAQAQESKRVMEAITASLGTLSFVRDVL